MNKDSVCCNAMSPLNNNFYFIVREDKMEEFLNHKKDTSKLDKVLNKAKRLSENIGVHE